MPSALNKKLFTLSGTDVTLLSILIFLGIILSAFLLSIILQKILRKALGKTFEKREGTLAAILRLQHYLIVLIGFGTALQVIGINLSALFAAGAVFAIAIGFAMQNIMQNFVSGVIILVERSIKPGDILEIEGKLVKVIAMGIRTTVVRTKLLEELIMPNSVIAQSTVKNYTLQDNKFLLGVLVGVSYDSDINKVITVLDNVATSITWKISDERRVLMKDFGSSSIDFLVLVYIDNPWDQGIYRSELRKEIWAAFKKENIVIAYPQLDVHLDRTVNESLKKLSENYQDKPNITHDKE